MERKLLYITLYIYFGSACKWRQILMGMFATSTPDSIRATLQAPVRRVWRLLEKVPIFS